MSNNPITRALRRLTASEDELAVEDQRAAARAGCTAVAECRDRQRVSVSGIIAALTPAPEGSPRLQAELEDRSGRLRLIWMGRRELRGVVPGAELRVSGRVSCQRSSRVMYNPAYEILGLPEAPAVGG